MRRASRPHAPCPAAQPPSAAGRAAWVVYAPPLMDGLWFEPPAPAGFHRCGVAPFAQALADAPPRRAFFFDVGASIYNTGAGGASQSWFVETYRRGGVEFDRIFAWEARAPKHSIA